MSGYHMPGAVLPYQVQSQGGHLLNYWTYTIRFAGDLTETQHPTFQLFNSPAEAKHAMRVNCLNSGNGACASAFRELSREVA